MRTETAEMRLLRITQSTEGLTHQGAVTKTVILAEVFENRV
jgi:hypothetical protein